MPQTTSQPELHARKSDPITSHLALAALGRDTSLKRSIMLAAFQLEERRADWNDTELTERVERITGKRQQRNVIARSRDLMTDEGWFEPVGIFRYGRRELMHWRLTAEAKVAR